MRDEVLRLTKGVIPPVRYACEHGVDFDSVCEACNAHGVHPAHPLKNPESTHYDIWRGLEAIEIVESVLSHEELVGWAKGNILKYRLRVSKKGDEKDWISDLKKIKTYEKYLAYLETL